MIKTLLTGTMLCLVPFTAMAADVPRAPARAPAIVAPAPSWAGFYLGAHFGYGWGDHATDLLTDTHASKGILGGVQVGYNFQTGNVVLGVEADWTLSDVKSNERVRFALGPALSTTDVRHKFDWFGTARLRLGYSFGSLLPYVTGGLAYGRIESSATAVNSGFGPPFDGTFHGADRQGHVGWALGGGIEFAFASNWSGKIEYLRVDLGKEHYLALPMLDPTPRAHEATVDLVRIGVNHRFGRYN